MKKWLFVANVICHGFLFSQNLITNPYLIKGLGCPIIAPGWERSGYNSTAITIDSLCTSGGSPWCCIGEKSVPRPLFLSGMMAINISENSWGEVRIFLGTAFTTPLTNGTNYMVEYWYRPWARNNYHINKIGAVITSDTITPFNYLNYLPTVEQIKPITDTTQWLHFKASFIAQGGEQIIWIGNLRPLAQLIQIPNYPNAPLQFNDGSSPMVFIDGVFVYKATDTVYSISLPKDTMLCPNQQLVLHPQRQGFKLEDTTTTYLWNTGSTDSSIVVTQPGTYWVRTTINHRFVAGDTIVVDFFPANYQLNLPDTVTFCEGTEAVIQSAVLPPNYAALTAYLWNTGSTLTGIAVRNPGLYWLTAQTPCYNLADSTWVLQDFCESYLWVPNAFTPDGDGTNDFFEFQGAPEPVVLHIFDRWGKRVFYSDNYLNNWDGTYQGEPLPGGVYTYLIEYNYINPNATQPDAKGSAQQARGTVTIIR
jgi:gliding motility-associated-like protein